MTTNPNPIEILYKLFDDGRIAAIRDKSPEEYIKFVDKALAALKKAMEGVIGDHSVPYTSSSPSNKMQPIYKTRNKLRDEQRQQLNALFGEIK